MKERIAFAVAEALNLGAVKSGVIQVLETLRKENVIYRIGYVSGIITSDGPKHVDGNI